MPFGVDDAVAIGMALLTLLGKKDTATRTADDPRYKSPSLGYLDPALLQGVIGNVQRTRNFGFPEEGKLTSSYLTDITSSLQQQWPSIIRNMEGTAKAGQPCYQDGEFMCKSGEHCVQGKCEPTTTLQAGETLTETTDPRYKSPSLGVLDPVALTGLLENYGRYENFGYPAEGKLGGMAPATATSEGGYLTQILESLFSQWPDIIKNWEGSDPYIQECSNSSQCEGDKICIQGKCGNPPITTEDECDPSNPCPGEDDGMSKCDNGKCVWIAKCSQFTNGICPDGYECEAGICKPGEGNGGENGCSIANCKPPKKCVNGECLPECSAPGDCPPEKPLCKSGVCVESF